MNETHFSQNEKKIRVATYNIMRKGKYSECLVSSSKRYKHIISHLIPNLDADILCLNDVSRSFYNQLVFDPYLQSTYRFSMLKNKSQETEAHQLNTVLLSKNLMKTVFQTSQLVASLVYCEDFALLMTAVQFHEYEINKRERKEQFQSVEILLEDIRKHPQKYGKTEKITHLLKLAFENNNVLIIGDLNFHVLSEFQDAFSLGYRDLWLERKSHFEGYTRDAKTNSMISRLNWFDNRRLRLDLLMMRNSKSFLPQNSFLWANKKLGSGFSFPSDRYGVAADLVFCFDETKSYEMVDDRFYLEANQKLQANSTGFRSKKQIDQYVTYSVMGLIVVVMIAVGILLLKFI